MAIVTGDLVSLYIENDRLCPGQLARDGEATPDELVEMALTIIEQINLKPKAVSPAMGWLARKWLPACRKAWAASEAICRIRPGAGEAVPRILRRTSDG